MLVCMETTTTHTEKRIMFTAAQAIESVESGSTQIVFDPTDFGFEWTQDGWYKFDYKLASLAAKACRDRAVTILREQGRRVRAFTLRNQLRTLGGIGTGKPQIEEIVNCYGFNVN